MHFGNLLLTARTRHRPIRLPTKHGIILKAGDRRAEALVGHQIGEGLKFFGEEGDLFGEFVFFEEFGGEGVEYLVKLHHTLIFLLQHVTFICFHRKFFLIILHFPINFLLKLLKSIIYHLYLFLYPFCPGIIRPIF
jgi:hypothetical protein